MPEDYPSYEPTSHISRDTSKGINELIISLMGTVANIYRTGTKPSEVMECERTIRILETMLGYSEKEQYEQIEGLREEQKKYSPPTSVELLEVYRDILIQRIDIVLFIMGRKGLLPNETREEVIQRPTGWKE